MSWWRELARLGALVEHAPLAPRTTLGVGGTARWLFRPPSIEALTAAMRLVPPGVWIVPIGRGSNLLPPDEELDALVIDLGGLHAMRVEETAIEAEAGVRLGRLSAQAAAAGLSGAEFLATIPGTVGGAVAMNAGAYGREIADCLQWVRCLMPEGGLLQLAREQIEFGYRHAALPEGAIVVVARFALGRDDPQRIRARIAELRAKRARTQPLERPNCGSVFKNPPGDFAARLIEAAGLKGARRGGAMISTKHANFIVNLGGATAGDVRALIELAQEEVERRFGVRLEPEVRILEARR